MHAQSAPSEKAGPLQLVICIGGIYASFVVWAICQERISTTPYESSEHATSDKFKSVLFLNAVQAFFSALAALVYLVSVAPRPIPSWRELIGLPAREANERLRQLALVAALATAASPFGFAALSHISFPTLLLGKSCKLVPVLLASVLIHRRRFPPIKYAVVLAVSGGIWAFMALAPPKPGGHRKGRETSSLLGLGLLGVNLMLDGAVNSGQDAIFKTFPGLQGAQMMLLMNVLGVVFLSSALVLPTALTPAALVPDPRYSSGLAHAMHFVATHPGVGRDIVLFGASGAIGQLFIFRTLASFGSLTLVTITVTRKMITMLLSVALFDHHLAPGQWVGVVIVFAAVAGEAELGRREKLARSRQHRGLAELQEEKQELELGNIGNGEARPAGVWNGEQRVRQRSGSKGREPQS